jgi:hypothetical protein
MWYCSLTLVMKSDFEKSRICVSIKDTLKTIVKKYLRLLKVYLAYQVCIELERKKVEKLIHFIINNYFWLFKEIRIHSF